LLDVVLSSGLFGNILVLLSDAPGMVKSSVLTKLEQDLRNTSKITFPCIIIRKNLNQCSTFLKVISKQEEITLSDFFQHLVDFIPTRNERNSYYPVPAYFLLDGFDEVVPLYKDAMMKLLKLLCFSGCISLWFGYYVQRVVLTTRPHLKEVIEKAFHVTAFSLDQLSTNEQIDYLLKNVKTFVTEERATAKLNELSESFRNLLSNPLMLSLYSQVCKTDNSCELNLFFLYSLFMEKKHELFVCEKENGDPDCQTTIRRKKQLLTGNLGFS